MLFIVGIFRWYDVLTYAHAHMYAQICVKHIFAHMHTHTYTHAQIHTYAHTHMCVCLSAYCHQTQNVLKFTHTHTDTYVGVCVVRKRIVSIFVDYRGNLVVVI